MPQIEIKITISLDPVPGWGHQAEDFLKHFQSPNCGVSHYIDKVELIEPPKAREKETFEPDPIFLNM